MKEILKQLEHFMYGYNYQVTFGYEILDSAKNLDEAIGQIKEIFKEAAPDEYPIKEAGKRDFHEEIEYGFSYRGDSSAGLILGKETEKKVSLLQKQYIDFINTFINENTRIYHYPSYKGIPIYPVFWDYRFIILNGNGNSLFIFGAASD